MKCQFAFAFAVLLVVVTCEATEENEEASTCIPGENFKLGCNSCICPQSGKKIDAACTLKACIENHNIPTTPAETEVDSCTPGSTFMKECNACTCPEDGSKSGAICTVLACSSESS